MNNKTEKYIQNMKRLIIPALIAVLGIPTVLGQSSIDALQLTSSDFKGTARFMGMGGAFTALGGDLSTLTQNPAGIGIYRHSEIGATLDINFQKSATSSASNSYSATQTKAYCNNFGYVGVIRLDGLLQSFNWGATYNRVTSFDRKTSGYVVPTNTSLSNYIASFTGGINPDELIFSSTYNPYRDSNHDWLSILAYNTYMISSSDAQGRSYRGLFQTGTTGDAETTLLERGYLDEYSFNFGGNFSNLVYWGLSVGVTDLSYTREVWYSESMENASVYDAASQNNVNGNAGINLSNYKHINGSGWNLKAGVIVRPTNEFRFGFAVHTPTWYSLEHSYYGIASYSYLNTSIVEGKDNPLSGSEYTDNAGFDWKLRSPWRLMAGVGFVGSDFIISADYEYVAYPDMNVQTAGYDNWGYITGYYDNIVVNEDIKTYTRGANIVRVGAEYRLLPSLSLRAGYNCSMSNIKDDVRKGSVMVVTSGTDPSFSFNKTTQNISVGIGYRYKSWYLDGAYVHTNRKGTLHAYTDFNGYRAPKYDVTDNDNQIVLSMGFKF